MAVFLVTRTDCDYEPIRVEAAGPADIREHLAHQDHLQEMIWVRTLPRFKHSYMRFADIEETKEPAEYRLVNETYGSKLVEV